MYDPMLNVDDTQPIQKVSISTRLVALFAFSIPLLGVAVGSLMMISLFQALRSNENAGMAAVMAGMKEASLPVIVSLGVAAFFAMVTVIVLIVRMIVQTQKTSPPFWFFIVGGIFSLVPAVMFWKAQLIVLDVLSPGSSLATGGMAAAGGSVANWLMMSLVAIPIVFIVMLAISVIPFSSRKGPKVISLLAAIAVMISFVAAAVGIPFLIDGPSRTNETVRMPTNIKGADEDGDLGRDSSLIVTLTAESVASITTPTTDDRQLSKNSEQVAIEQLSAKISKAMDGKSPEKRIVYLKCDANAPFEGVYKVFQAVSKADIDKIGLVVIGNKNPDDPYQTAPLRFELRLKESSVQHAPIKPNPLSLLASLENDGKLKLNSEDMGSILDFKKLETTLRNVFRERENNGVFREGTNEVEKTLFVYAAKSTKYGEFITLVAAVKTAGASPIVIHMLDGGLR